MRFIIFTTILVITTVTALGQVDKTTTDYSESVPYQPTVFAEKKEDKKKEDKKKKNEELKKEDPKITINLNNFENKFEIPVYVFDKSNNPVVDLKKEDFTLLINDKEFQIEDLQPEVRPMNVILLVDTSASAQIEKIEVFRNFVIQLAEKFVPQNLISVFLFDEKIRELIKETNDLNAIKKSVSKIENGGGTSIYDVVSILSINTFNSKAKNTVVFLLTDGVDTTSKKLNYELSLKLAEISNLTFYPFYLDTYDKSANSSNRNMSAILSQILKAQINGGIMPNGVISGNSKEDYDLAKKYLTDLTNLSGGRFESVKNLKNLKNEDLDFLLNNAKPQYSLSFDASQLADTGDRVQIKVRVNRPNLLIRTRGSRIISTK